MKQSFWILMLAMLLPMFTFAQTSSKAKQKSYKKSDNRNITRASTNKSSFEERGRVDSTVIKDKYKNNDGKWQNKDTARVKGKEQGEYHEHNGQHGNSAEQHGHQGEHGKANEQHGHKGEHGKSGEYHGPNGDHHSHDMKNGEHHHDDKDDEQEHKHEHSKDDAPKSSSPKQ